MIEFLQIVVGVFIVVAGLITLIALMLVEPY